MRKIALALGILAIMHACSNNLTNAPVNLKVEYGSSVVDEITPRFSWTLNDTTRGAKQNAYHVLVASSPKLLNENKADIWNSGKVDSDQSVFVSYQGSPLQSGERYFWTIKVWNQDNLESEWSTTQIFDMGFLDASLWQAKWIGANESAATVDSLRPKSIILRNEINIQKKIKIAKAYVTGLGSYQLFMNGEKVSNNLLTPGWTDYPTRIIYQVYDLTNQLIEGTNTAGLMLGNVWYSSGLGWKGGSSYSHGPMMGLLQLEIEYTDGSREVILSDDSWKWHFSPITENTLYHGEHYDARLELDGWKENGFDDSDWDQADLFEAQEAILSAHTSPMIKITREIAPVSVKKLENNSFIFDMGLNMTGGIRLNVEGEAGTEIVMKFAELLHEDGTVAQENLRSAIVTDKYTLRGDGPESWEPAFTYHGFRYVEISGLPNEPDSETVIGLNYHNAAKESGTFECSNELINTIQANIQNGQRSNMFSVPTDCPQRDERLGWMGDAQIFAATSCYNMDMSGFYAKWVRDISDSQDEEGWVTDVNPAIVVTGPAKPAWGDAFTIVPWEMYRFYNDTRILEKFYDDYKAWVEYMRSNTEPDGLYIFDQDGWGGYADWIAVVESPKQPISAAYYYFSTKLLAKFADILNYADDKTEYSQLASEIEAAFQKRYFSEKLSNYEGGTQTAMLLPMNFGLTPKDQMEKVAANLLADVEEKGKHPSTGFLGTKYLLPTLSDFGYHAVAFETVTSEEYPSWGYMAVNGATSMWELWNSDTEKPEGMNSRNHFALGSIGEWFYSHLAGIRIDDANPGFKHSIIAPMPAEGLDWAKGKIATPFGVLKSSWTKKAGIFSLDVTIPPNTTATVKIPLLNGSRMEIYEGGSVLVKETKIAGEVDGINFVHISESTVEMEVASGEYKFELLY
jgi:alpha-L-rhamnosidase